MRFLRDAQEDSGATVVEMAIIVTTLFAIIFGLLDFGLIEIGGTVGSNAAREGARYGIINVDCADSYPGSTDAGHDSCSSPSSNYNGIVAAVKAKLAGLVRANPTVTVRCLDGTDPTLATVKACSVAGAVALQPDVDLIEVTVQWTHLGGSGFVANSTHTDVARMVIVEAPQSVPPTTTSTSTTSTSTTSTSTTSTTTTSTTLACSFVSGTVTPNPDSRNGNSSNLSTAPMVSVTTSSSCSSITATVVEDGGATSQTISLAGSPWTGTFNKNGNWTASPPPKTVTIKSNGVTIGTVMFDVS